MKRDYTEKDLTLLEFMFRTGWTNINQCALVLEGNRGTQKQQYYRMKARIHGLRSLNAVAARQITGGGYVLRVLKQGLDVLDITGRVAANEVDLKKGSRISLKDISHSLSLSQVAAGLINGENAPIGRSYGQASLYDLIYDGQMEADHKTWENFFNRQHADYLDRFDGAQREMMKQNLAMKHAPADSLVLIRREPDLNGKVIDHFTHRPDLVWQNATEGKETGLTVAIELELSPKTWSRYVETISLYKQNPTRYDRIVWVSQSEAIAKRINAVAASLDYGHVVKVVRLKGCDGLPFTKSPWLL